MKATVAVTPSRSIGTSPLISMPRAAEGCAGRGERHAGCEALRAGERDGKIAVAMAAPFLRGPTIAMDTRILTDTLTNLLSHSPLAIAGAIVLAGIVLLLVGWRLGRRQAAPLLPETGEPGVPAAGEIPHRVADLLSPEPGGALPAIEVPPPPPEPVHAAPVTAPTGGPGANRPAAPWVSPRPREEPPLFRPPERTPRPPQGKEATPHPATPRWRMRPEEVRSQPFRRRLRGYDRREVYEYLVAVSDELGALQRRALESRQEGQDLRAELSRWRDQAGTVQNTLAAAQKLAEEMIGKAQEEATREAERIVQDALERLARLQQEIGRLQQDRSRIREEVRRDALAFAAALRELETGPILPMRAGGPPSPGDGPQGPPGP